MIESELIPNPMYLRIDPALLLTACDDRTATLATGFPEVYKYRSQ